MKEYEKILVNDTKRKTNEKARNEIKLGLFEQKKEDTFDFSNYSIITYGKKYKGLYDLYQNNDTYELVYVCPLVENNKDESGEDEKVMTPYAYDVLYLEFLNEEEYELVKKASVHENSLFLDIMFNAAIIAYFVLAICSIVFTIVISITNPGLVNVLLVCGPLLGSVLISTILLPVLIIKYRNFKAE